MLLGLLSPAAVAYAQPAPDINGIAQADQQLLAIALDPQAELRLRRDAVTGLMDRGDDRALSLLIAALKEPKDATCRRSIIWGIRNCKSPPAEVAKLLADLAGDLDGLVHEDAAEVIGRALPSEDWKTIHQIAGDESAKPSARQLAILSLGHRRTQASARALIDLLSAAKEDGQRSMVAGALARLSGMDDIGTNPTAWREWWGKVEKLGPEAWQAHLLGNIVRRTERLTRQRDTLQERLMTAMRQRYRAVPREEREPVLIAMLADPLDAVRVLALELVRELINSETIGPALTDSLLTRLDDQSAAVRSGAALIVRDLKNESAADLVAKRLADDLERDKGVLRAYLLIMRRQPRLGAMAPAIGLLTDPEVRAEAAGTLLAGFDHQPPMIGREQAQRIAEVVRTQLTTESTPEPRFIELLGRVGSREDLRLIRGWLDHKSDAVREAAARAWVATDQSLEPLAVRASDPVIQVIVIPAATQRGKTAQTLLALASHRPGIEQIAAAWGRALVAMSPRVEPDAVVRADRTLADHGDLTELRLQFLSPAIDKLLARVATEELNGFTDVERQVFTLQLIDLLLARTESRLLAGDGKAALADLDRVKALKVDLSDSQHQRFTLDGIHARLLSGDLDDAYNEAGRYLSGDLNTDAADELKARIVDLLLTTSEQFVAAKQNERAGQIVSRLRTRLPRPVELKHELRMTLIEQRIKMATPTP